MLGHDPVARRDWCDDNVDIRGLSFRHVRAHRSTSDRCLQSAMSHQLSDPSVVISTLARPLLSSETDGHDAHVPNVAYVRAALLHAGVLTGLT
jgi:hypothetical protein